MKKEIISILCCAAGLMLCSCGAKKEFVITGKLDNSKAQFVTINCVPKGLCDTIPVAADGTFSYSRHIGAPEYGYISSDEDGYFTFIYLIDGTSTHLTADATDYSSTRLTGDLEAAYPVGDNISRSIGRRSEHLYESFAELREDWHQLRDSVDRALAAVGINGFTRLQHDSFESGYEGAAINYANSLAARGRAADSDADLNAFMASLDWNKASFQGYLMEQVLRWQEACAGRGDNPSYVNMVRTMGEKISDTDARTKAVMNLMSTYFSMGADTHIDEVCAEALKYVQNEKAREWIENYNDKLKNVVPGVPAIDCELERLDGSKLRLSDLYGEVLFIDIWATWCGPCCEEIPHLEKLVERFRGDKRVRFVSITVDRNRAAWEKKLAADKPEWEQYRCVDFCELYGIAGLPCFMMIDREGKLITMQAPRPSDDGCDDFIKSKL